MASLSIRQRHAQKIHEILDELFPIVGSPLAHETPFQLLVATILSAQCTDARVNMVTPALFARAPDARTMAKLTARQVLPYIKSLGLARNKAKNLAAMAKLLVARHDGQVPRTLDELEDLPGVGHKTASVVIAQAFGEPAFPVDTHIHRLAGRWGLSRARSVEEVERDLKELFPREHWNALHLQIIFFGRSHCPARGHVKDACPICGWAMSNARDGQERRRALASKRRRRSSSRPSAGRSSPARKPAASAGPADRVRSARSRKPAEQLSK
jgi:endonuclease-3